MERLWFYLLGKALVIEYRRRIAYMSPGGKPYDGGAFDGAAAAKAHEKWERSITRRERLFWRAERSA